MGLFPRKDWTVLSHRLILHGRDVCRSRGPRCGACILSERCAHCREPRAFAGTRQETRHATAVLVRAGRAPREAESTRDRRDRGRGQEAPARRVRTRRLHGFRASSRWRPPCRPRGPFQGCGRSRAPRRRSPAGPRHGAHKRAGVRRDEDPVPSPAIPSAATIAKSGVEAPRRERSHSPTARMDIPTVPGRREPIRSIGSPTPGPPPP